MGDRGNIIVKDMGSEVYLYTHGTGSYLPETLKRALARKQRWDDGPYLARIIFCEMIKGSEADETGFGISSKRGDGGTDITVNVDDQTVSRNGKKTVSFAEYIQ